MLLETSQITKKVVGRLDSGKDLIISLTDTCRAHVVGAGSIEVFGSLSSIELIAYQKGGEAVTLHKGSGSFTILSCTANVAMYGSEIVIDARCVVSANGPLGPQILGGILKSATIESVDIIVSSFDDLVIERQPNFKEGRFTIEGFRRKSSSKLPTTAPPVAEESPKESAQNIQPELSWDEAADLTTQQTKKKRLVPRHERIADLNADLVSEFEDDDEETEIELSAGDLLLHPKLGECRVIKVEGDDFARVRLPKGQLRKLSLAICVPKFVERKNDRNIFKVQIN